MKERPILFSGEMVRALLEGRKTQTRRMVKPQPPREAVKAVCVNDWWMWERWAPDRRHVDGKMSELQSDKRCPYGVPGDRLWVRETHAPAADCWGRWQNSNERGRNLFAPVGELHYRADGGEPFIDRWRPAIHMPRWASRITLEVTEIRVERVQDISHRDCIAEGCASGPWKSPDGPVPEAGRCSNAVWRYHLLWERINGAGAWEKNPWVWVIGFKRVTP